MFNKALKWIGIILGGLVGLLTLAILAIYLLGTAKINKKYKVPVEAVTVPTDARSVQRGKHLATIFICTRCHTESLKGDVYFEVPGMVSIPTPNLTSGAGGVVSYYNDEDWVREL